MVMLYLGDFLVTKERVGNNNNCVHYFIIKSTLKTTYDIMLVPCPGFCPYIPLLYDTKS